MATPLAANFTDDDGDGDIDLCDTPDVLLVAVEGYASAEILVVSEYDQPALQVVREG